MGRTIGVGAGRRARRSARVATARFAAMIIVGVAMSPGPAGCDCILDLQSNPVPPFTTFDTLFPNWVDAPAAAFTMVECDDAVCTACTTSTIVALTILNYGTATGGAAGDVTGLSFSVVCGSKTNVGPLAMTYAGIWAGRAAWTWTGSIAWGANPCNGPGFSCACGVDVQVFADIGPCPTAGRTVNLGPGFNDVLNPGWPGGMYDSCACAGPWSQVQFGVKTIDYISKVADRDTAAPGDTINYTIYYGRPGSVALASITITDTQPPFTHLLPGIGTPPDPGWDPDPGPPLRLRWTDATVSPVTGGPTESVTFALTVDWGNGEAFEPGSGDVAAPEGTFLTNRAQMAWAPSPACASGHVSLPTLTSVQRFLFWKLGDNDILFANAFGQPADEMTYSIFVKNLSPTKTWWNVSVWDTVPAEVDPWGAGYGLEDACTGWTMTPSGCAAASAGWYLTGAKTTVLTWRMDMPPQATLELRWKAAVRPAATAGATAVNIASVLENGLAGIVGGTGSSVTPRQFTHQAAIVLQTTYVSYLSLAAASANFWGCNNTGGAEGFTTQSFWISFFPLNKKADFNLYEQLHFGDAFEAAGGASPPITAFVGGCMTGGAPWIPGCKVERAPAYYRPTAYAACASATNIHFLWKLVSNSPMLWELTTGAMAGADDRSTYQGTTSLTYAGFATYGYSLVGLYPQQTDALYLINTSPATPTTLHVFRWDPLTLAWVYRATSDVNLESQWLYNPDVQGAYRVISSDAPIIIQKGYPGMGVGGSFNDSGEQSPNKENGYLVSTTVPASFYAYGADSNDGASLVVGNVGAANATYEIWEYTSDTPSLPNPTTTHLTAQLLGNSGQWIKIATDSVPTGLANPANPHAYGQGYDPLLADQYALYKVKLLSGGPIQVYNGRDVYSGYGCGSVMHSVTPPLGVQFWFQEAIGSNSCGGSDQDVMTLDFFCPKQGTVVTAVSSDGASESYATPGADSCVSFKSLTTPAASATRNWRITAVGGSIVSALQIHCQLVEKLYTAPFLNLGTHYVIIAPPVVFTGQSFWITIVVAATGGATQTDYCGVTSFTSTDPAAAIGGTGLDLVNYTWDSLTGGCGSSPYDNGVHLFLNVTLSRLGLQTLVAVDTVDGSITGLTTIMVVGADVKLTKEPRLTVGASGDTVQFRICWSNYSSASAFTFVITDAIPQGTSFVPEVSSAAFNCGSTDGVTPVVAYSATASATPPAAFTTGNPPGGTYWLRFTIPQAGVQTTGCVCYRVSVN